MSTHPDTTTFGAALAAHAEALTSAPADATGAPSNQQILDAARQAYGTSHVAVDASVEALVASVGDDSLAAARIAIDTATWTNGSATPALADPFFATASVAAAEAAAQAAGMATYSIGVFSEQLPGGTRGMIAFARPVGGGDPVTLELQLDIWQHMVSVQTGENLQYGMWTASGAALNTTQVYGLYTTVTVQAVAVNLKVVLSSSLAPYGFVVSAGATLDLPVSVSVFGGSTMVLGEG